MNFLSIVEELSITMPAKIISNKLAYDINDIALLENGQNDFSVHTLYFGYDTQFTNTMHNAQCIIGYNTASQSTYISDNNNIALLPASNLFAAFNFTKTLIESCRSKGLYQELVDHVSKTQSIDSLLNVAASKLGNSLILLDVNYKIISHSTIFPISDSLWANNIKQGYCDYEFINAVNELETMKNSLNNSEVIEVSCYASPLRKLSCRLIYNKEQIGILLMIEKESQITQFHFDSLHIISKAVCYCLIHYAAFLLPANTNYEKLLYNLLIGTPPEELQKQISSLAFSPNMIAFCILNTGNLGQKHLKESICSSLIRNFPDSHMTFHEGNVVGVLPLGKDTYLSNENLSILNTFADNKSIRIGISNVFSNISDFNKYYIQAHTALDLSNRFHGNENISQYVHYEVYDLLNNIQYKIHIENFCHPALGILRKYDNENNTDLYKTLKVYLRSGKCSKTTAQKLYIHRNSLTHRLERIAKVAGVDLSDDSTVFHLVLSYYIMSF